MLQVNSADIIVLGDDATKTNTVELSAIEVGKGVKIELIYTINVEAEHCKWCVTKTKKDFLEMNAKLPINYQEDLTTLFPRRHVIPNKKKLTIHHNQVQPYVKSLLELEEVMLVCVAEFFEYNKHDVQDVTENLIKDLRRFGAQMLNDCEEALTLTEEQLHAISCTLHDTTNQFDVSFLELQRTLEEVNSLRVIRNENGCHEYKTHPILDLSYFQSLLNLELQNINFGGVVEMGSLADSLQHITITGDVITELKEVLIWLKEEVPLSSTPGHMTTFPESQGPVWWEWVETVDFSRNKITLMDDSLQMLIALKSLNLSYNMIECIENIQGLPYLTDVNISHNNISNIDTLHLRMGNVTRLNLSYNKLSKLAGLEKLYSLEMLNISYNNVDQINEVARLKRLPHLTSLHLAGNDISSQKKPHGVWGLEYTYRVQILHYFNNVDKFYLDGACATDVEIRRLNKLRDREADLIAAGEETLCVVELGDEFDETSDIPQDDNIIIEEVKIVETKPSINRTKTRRIAHITDLLEEELQTKNERSRTLLDVEHCIKEEGDDWIQYFMTMLPDIKEVEETRDDLSEGEVEQDSGLSEAVPVLILKEDRSIRQFKRDEDKFSDWSSDGRSESSLCSSLSIQREPAPQQPAPPAPPPPLFKMSDLIAPSDDIQTLLEKNSGLLLSELRLFYSCFRENELVVLGVDITQLLGPVSLYEVNISTGQLVWAVTAEVITLTRPTEAPGLHTALLRPSISSISPLFLEEQYACEIDEFKVSITKDNKDVRTFEMRTVKDVANLYLVCSKLKSELEDASESDEMGDVPTSDRIYRDHVSNLLSDEEGGEDAGRRSGTLTEDMAADDLTLSFHTHCFRYNEAHVALPSLVALTNNEIIIYELECGDMLSLSQETLQQLLDQKSLKMWEIYRERVENIKEIVCGYFDHTLRIEFTESNSNNSLGSARTTFTLLDYTRSDYDVFIEQISIKLSTLEISVSDTRRFSDCDGMALVRDQSYIRGLEKALKLQCGEVDSFKCFIIREMGDSLDYYRCLILTTTTMYIVEEDFVRWPPPCFVTHTPNTPRFCLLNDASITDVIGVTIYTNMYRGGYVLELQTENNMNHMTWELLISTFEDREQLIGHIDRTWTERYGANLNIASIPSYRSPVVRVSHRDSMSSDAVLSNGVHSTRSHSNIKDGILNNLLDLSVAINADVEKFVQGDLKAKDTDTTVLYSTVTHCMLSESVYTELKCGVIITKDMLYIVTLKGTHPDEIKSSNLPGMLCLLVAEPVGDIRQIVCGLFDQKIRLEFGADKGVIAIVTRDVQETCLLKQIVMEALHCQYDQNDLYSSPASTNLITRKGREISIISPDDFAVDNLRYVLSDYADIKDYNDITIINYYLLYRCEELEPLTLVLTTCTVYLIREDHVSWPLRCCSEDVPKGLQYTVMAMIHIEDIVCVQYSYITSTDIVLLHESREVPVSCAVDNVFEMVDSPEPIGSTTKLLAASYHQRDHIIRMLIQLKLPHELPVKKLD